MVSAALMLLIELLPIDPESYINNTLPYVEAWPVA